ncbi:hypothetical protein Hanom_Chr00s000735g01656511 [Helianthus anomalus]
MTAAAMVNKGIGRATPPFSNQQPESTPVAFPSAKMISDEDDEDDVKTEAKQAAAPPITAAVVFDVPDNKPGDGDSRRLRQWVMDLF